ncbi:hypothetical protein N9752_03560 [Polaribacter sp.]|nr:hypothetical protein [Polaribacter sp.]
MARILYSSFISNAAITSSKNKETLVVLHSLNNASFNELSIPLDSIIL